MSETNELKQTVNVGNIKGKLSEKKLDFFTDDKGNIEGIRGDIVVDSEMGKIKFNVYSKALTKAGEKNRMYDMILALKHEYVAEIDADADNPVSYLTVGFQLRGNDYVNRQGSLGRDVSLSLNTCSRITESEAESIDPETDNVLALEGVIGRIADASERERINEGDLIIDFTTIGYSGDAVPFNILIPAEYADVVRDSFTSGDTTTFSIEPRMIHVDGRPKKKAMIGRSVSTSRGYDRFALVMVGALDPYDENEALDTKLIKTALQERKIYLEDLEKKGYKGKGGKTNTLVKEASSAIKDEDIPF